MPAEDVAERRLEATEKRLATARELLKQCKPFIRFISADAFNPEPSSELAKEIDAFLESERAHG